MDKENLPKLNQEVEDMNRSISVAAVAKYMKTIRKSGETSPFSSALPLSLSWWKLTDLLLGQSEGKTFKGVSTTNGHLPRTLPMTEQQRHLPSVSMEIEPHAAVAGELQQPLREFTME